MPKPSRMMMLVLMLLLLSVALAGAASAAETRVQLRLTPVGVEGAYFDLTLNPGETRELTVELANFGDETVEVRTYAADVYSLVNGGFGARLADEPTSGATHWLDYAGDRFYLEPGAALQRTFTVSVPADAEPGEYLSSLVLQNAEPVALSNGGNIGFNQVLRQVIAVAIDVPGPRVPALAIGGAEYKASADGALVVFGVENPGNVRLRPAGEFRLETVDGVEVSRAAVAMESVYARTGTLLEAPLAEPLQPGDYLAYLTLRDAVTGVEAFSGPLPLNVPVLQASQPAGAAPSGAAAAQERAGARSVDDRPLEPWVLGLGLLLGLALGALAAWLVIRRRAARAPLGSVAPRLVHPPQQRPSPPVDAAVARRSVRAGPPRMRPLVPPSRRSDSQPTGTDA